MESISNYGNAPQRASIIYRALRKQGWRLSPQRPGLCLQKPLPSGGMAYASFLPLQRLLRLSMPLPLADEQGKACILHADYAWADLALGQGGCFIGGLPDPYGAYDAAN